MLTGECPLAGETEIERRETERMAKTGRAGRRRGDRNSERRKRGEKESK